MSFYSDLKKFNNRTALIFKDNNFSYEKLLRDADEVAKKIEKRSLIFVLGDNDPETIITLIASDICNSVVMLLDNKINYNALFELIRLYMPDIIVLSKEKKLKINNFESYYSIYNYNILKSKKEFKKQLNENLILLQTTSGSTGSPKNVRLSFKNLKSNSDAIIKNLNISSDDITITTLPPSYVFGLSILNTHLKSGAKIILNKSSIIEKDFWEKLILNKVNNFGGVPYIYEMISKVGLKKENFNYLNYTTVAGGHLHDNLKLSILDFYEKYNTSLITMYGAAEATARMSYLPAEFSRKKIGSIGIPIDGGSFYLEDENKNKIIEPNTNGELVYKGDNVCMGYAYSYEDLGKEDINKSILETRDIAYKDKDNFYYIIGKKDRYIKLAGNRISLDEVEKIIFNFGFKVVCCQNIKDKMSIFVNEKNIEKKIIDYISDYTSLHKNLFKVFCLEKFPLNKNNKIDYNSDLFKLLDRQTNKLY